MGKCKPSGGVEDVNDRSLPKDGQTPNSKKRLFDDEGLKQERWYGPDGRAIWDRDYRHKGKNEKFPHDHEWDHTKKKPRGKKQPPNPMFC